MDCHAHVNQNYLHSLLVNVDQVLHLLLVLIILLAQSFQEIRFIAILEDLSDQIIF